VKTLRAVTCVAPRLAAEHLFARPEALFFWDGAVGLGEAARIEAAGPERFADLRRQAAALYASVDGPAPPLYGGLAFAPGFADASWARFADASFVLPRWLLRDGMLTFTGPGAPPDGELAALLEPAAAPAPPRADRVARARPEFLALVRAVRAEIAAGRAEKIVAARRAEVTGRFDDAAVLARLPDDALRFAFRRGPTTFLGATPERLLTKRGAHVRTEAIAGTSTSGAFGAKDRAEHAPVVRAIADALADARVEVGPVAARAVGELAHLVTPIVAELAAPAHVLDIAAALHPTPAVAGAPRARAVAWIRAHEAPRGWYTGAVGWIDRTGDGELAVALRCGLVRAERAVLFAGAGIVAGSEPDAEYDETLLKERPMLRALGAA
jgi:isochorismate synthase